MALQPGSRLGQYDIIELIGAGGIGEVYRAHDRRLQRDVALKTLQIETAELRQRFEREALAIAALNHPNIVTIYSVDEANDTPFLTMELVEGETLAQLIPEAGLPLERLLELAVPIVEALSVAHAKGIIHRDLKPANIMVTRQGRVKVLDFGLAKVAGSGDAAVSALETLERTAPHTVLGTLAYMSPEQARGNPVDHRSDVFSMGVVLYEMATGQRPFRGPTAAAILDAQLNSPAPPIRSGAGTGLAELDRIIARALAKKPGARFQSADDLLAELRTLLTGRPGSAALATPARSEPAAVRPPSVAVLPFVNMSADPEQEYFCDGMAEELIGTLSRVEGLAVVARTSTFQFKGQSLDAREIGERLGVKTVVSGSVRRAGNRLRITAQLVDAKDGFQVWSESYERTLDDVFAIQDEIAKAISDSLRVRLGPPSGTPLIDRGTDNLEAYNLYLQGRFNMNRLSVDIRGAMFAARGCYEQAVALDPGFAAAHAGLSMCYNALGYQTLMPAGEAGRMAFEAAERAIALDPKSPEAHTALGYAKTVFSIDLATAEQSFLEAISLGPSCAEAYAWYSVLLTALGRFDEAEAAIARARALDPLQATLGFNSALNQVSAKDYQPAIQGMRALIALEPGFAGAYWFLGLALGGAKSFEEAIAALERGAELTLRAPLFVGLLGALYAHAGRREPAQAVLAELERGPQCPQYVFALIHGALGDLTRGMDLLEAAVESHDDMVFLAKVDWRFDCLRADPRFPRLLERMGLAATG